MFKTMKKLVLIIFISLIGSFVYSQVGKIELPKIEPIGKIAPGGVMSIKCEKIGDKKVKFTYQNAKYSTLKDWKYFELNSLEDLETVYQEITKGFEEMPSDRVILDISNGYLILFFSRFLGGKVVRLAHSDENVIEVGYTYQYTQKQIDKLFGKEKK